MNPITYAKFFLGNLLSQFTTADDDKPLSQLLAEAKQYYDPVLPRNADADTRLDSVEVEGSRLIMNNTLVTVTADELDAGEFRGVLAPVLVAETRRWKRLSRILEKGGTLVYRYVDMDGMPITDVVISN